MYWYANAGSAFHKIKSDPRKIVEPMNDDDFAKYIVFHNMDSLMIEEVVVTAQKKEENMV